MLRLFLLPILTLLIGFLFSPHETATDTVTVTDYPEHLTGTFTGSFGEQTCRNCHFDYDLNPEGGIFSVTGIGESVSAGEQVEIEISVSREELGAGGFQLSARYEDGRQAGSFNIEGNERLMFTKSAPDSLQYVQHSEGGTDPSGKKDTIRWTVVWQAPDSPSGSVIFNIAANAANGDQSEFGDFIYSKEVKAGF